MKIYVASSWRNTFQPTVVGVLREAGHQVYDFKDSEGFRWSEVDPEWQEWPSDIPRYLEGLKHPAAERGFNRDMTALRECDVCVYVMPCGVSASLEAGWACGAGKLVIVYVPGLREADLMVKMADLVTDSLEEVVRRIDGRIVADPLRCEVCGWPLAKSAEFGCVPGNCSYRPEEGSVEYMRIKRRRAELVCARERDRR